MSESGETGSCNVSDPVPVAETQRGRVFSAYVLVQIGLLLGLLWKISYFRLADQVHEQIPINDPFFPSWLQSPFVLRVAYLTSITAIVLGIISPWRWSRVLSAATVIGATVVMCLHQASYNDATFTTSFWVALWVFWYATRMGVDRHDVLLSRAAFLSRAIGSLILLGGAVGKWTPEYWSGDVFFDIYFRDRDYWVFNYLRETYDPEALRALATWYSRKVILIESIAGFGLWLLPAKWAAALGVVLFTSIALFSNFWLFSVLWCLIALSAVGFLVKQPANDSDVAPQSTSS